MFQISTILHPTDFSAPSEHAFHLACSLARDHGGHVIVLHVAEPPLVAPGSITQPPAEGVWSVLEAQLRTVRTAEVPLEHVLTTGKPADEILRVATAKNCDLIVMGTHGRSGLAHLLMGSVAETIVRRAECPVLVVKTPKRETPENSTGPST